jgi:hypothetical protein
MATEKNLTSEPDPTTLTPAEMFAQMQQFAKVIGEGVAAGIAKNTPRKVTIGQYDPKTPFHPNRKTASLFTRDYYQNGFKLEWDTTSDAEIDLLNKITHSGRYINRLVEVVVNNDSADEVVYINFNCKSADQRFALARVAPDFENMLTQIITAQKLEDEDELDRQTRPRRKVQVGA